MTLHFLQESDARGMANALISMGATVGQVHGAAERDQTWGCSHINGYCL